MRHFKLATTLTLLCCTLAFATEYTWDGEGAGGKQWTNDLMWAGDAKPTMSADNTLVFDGTSYIITTNTFPMHSDIGWIKIAPTAAPFLFARQSSSLGDRLDVFSGFEHNAANVVSNLMATDVWGDWMVNVSDPAGELHQVGVMLTEDNVAHAISKFGPGKYQLFGNNAGLTGTVTVADGTLVVRSVTSLGAAVSDVIVSNGATLDMYG
ncbi:hypothetical protein GX586_00895, partial [bacterium]|nr:hypothetical protein [bacterium]